MSSPLANFFSIPLAPRPGAAIQKINFQNPESRIKNQNQESIQRFIPAHAYARNAPTRAREHFLATVSFLSEIN